MEVAGSVNIKIGYQMRDDIYIQSAHTIMILIKFD
jgi:hypothetical protein